MSMNDSRAERRHVQGSFLVPFALVETDVCFAALLI